MNKADKISALAKLAQEGLVDRSQEYGGNAQTTRTQVGGMKTMPIPVDYKDGGMKTMPRPLQKDDPSWRKDLISRLEGLSRGANRFVRGVLPIPHPPKKMPNRGWPFDNGLLSPKVKAYMDSLKKKEEEKYRDERRRLGLDSALALQRL